MGVLFGAWLVSVVVAALQELNPVGLDQVDTAMLLGDAPGPDIGAEVFQGFGLADAVEGVAQNGLNQIQLAQTLPTMALISFIKRNR